MSDEEDRAPEPKVAVDRDVLLRALRNFYAVHNPAKLEPGHECIVEALADEFCENVNELQRRLRQVYNGAEMSRADLGLEAPPQAASISSAATTTTAVHEAVRHPLCPPS